MVLDCEGKSLDDINSFQGTHGIVYPAGNSVPELLQDINI